MARGTKTGDAGLAPRIRSLAARGLSNNDVTQQLQDDGIDISRTTVQRVLSSDNAERRAAWLAQIKHDAADYSRIAAEAQIKIIELGLPMLDTLAERFAATDKAGPSYAWATVGNAVTRAAASLAAMAGAPPTTQVTDQRSMVINLIKAYGAKPVSDANSDTIADAPAAEPEAAE